MAYVPEVDDFPDYLSEGARITIHHSRSTIRHYHSPIAPTHSVASCPCPSHTSPQFLSAPNWPSPCRQGFRLSIYPSSGASEGRHTLESCRRAEGVEMYRRDPMADPPTTAARPQLNRPSYGDEDEGVPSEPDYVWERYYCAVMDAAFLAGRSVYLRLSALKAPRSPSSTATMCMISHKPPQRARTTLQSSSSSTFSMRSPLCNIRRMGVVWFDT